MNTCQRRRALFWCDVLLIPLFIANAVTGIGLHRAGHTEPHEVWEAWAVAHVVSAVIWLGIGGYHIWRHWAWYKSLFRQSAVRRRRATLLLSAVFLVMAGTGVVLLTVIEGSGSHVGVWHFGLGIGIIVLSLLHIAGRWKALQSLGRRPR